MPVNPAQHQLDAYNNKDIERFLEAYSNDVKVFEHPDTLTMSGIDALRENYTKLFATYPKMHAHLENRIDKGDFVIDHEKITGRVENQTIEVIAIYEIEDEKIKKVWFIR